MVNWPSNYDDPWTLAGSVSRTGVCLHSGQVTEVHLCPSRKPGIHLSWMDSKDPPITLHPSQVRDTPLCTSLEVGGRRLSMVEHLLAAIAGCGITHVQIVASGGEVPLLDGSSIEWVEAIEEAGLQHAPTLAKKTLPLEKPLVLNRGSSVVAVTPAEKFSLVGLIDFPYRPIGKQMFSVILTPEVFVKEIAPARTFGFLDQVEELRETGLIRGGTLDNALVCDGEKWINPPLRFADEPIRHKLLDLIGDLALVGFPKAQVLVYRGSHGLHSDLASELHKHSSNFAKDS